MVPNTDNAAAAYDTYNTASAGIPATSAANEHGHYLSEPRRPLPPYPANASPDTRPECR